MSTPASSGTQELASPALTAYAAPAAGSSMLASLLLSFVPGIYAKYFGLSLVSIAAITLVVRLVDAVGDGVVGYWNDHRRSAGRSPLVLVTWAAFAFVLSIAMLAKPPGAGTAVWFAFWLLVAFTAYSLFEIPHNAWGADLAQEYGARSRLFAFRAFAQYGGMFVLYLIPLLPFQDSAELTPEFMLEAAIAASIVFVLGLSFLRRVAVGVEATAVHRPHPSITDMLRSVGANRPFLQFLAAYFLCYIGAGMYGGLLFLYVDVYLGLAERVALIFALAAPTGVVATPAWYWMTRRFGKRRTWFCGVMGLGVCLLAAGTVDPGEHALPLIIAATLLLFAFAACIVATAPAVLADLVDYGRWKFDRDLAGTYYAAFSLVTKGVLAIGAAFALGVAGFFGFSPGTGAADPEALFGLKLGFAWLPAAFVAASLPLIWLTPITPHRLAVLQRRIARRGTGARAGHATTGENID